MPITNDRFQALGSTIEGGFRGDPVATQGLWRQVQSQVTAFGDRFSRFLPGSELSQLNAQAGTPTHVSQELFDLLRVARMMWEKTSGLVDPTIGYALIQAGYDRSFEKLRDSPKPPTRPNTKMALVKATMADVELDPKALTAQLPLNVSLDLGGIGKGYLLDALLPTIDAVTTDYWLSLGGDLLVSGVNEQGKPWAIGVQDPTDHAKDWAKLVPPAGRWSIATSGVTKRRGVHAGVPWHHLIDPRTGKPSTTDVLGATVLAPTAIEADVFAKTVLLQGSADGISWAEQQPNIHALVITAEGTIQSTSNMKPLLRIP